jgi:hypothetical protein
VTQNTVETATRTSKQQEQQEEEASDHDADQAFAFGIVAAEIANILSCPPCSPATVAAS